MDLIPNNWKNLIRNSTYQKSTLKNLYYNNKSTRKAKDLKKLSNKEVYCSVSLTSGT